MYFESCTHKNRVHTHTLTLTLTHTYTHTHTHTHTQYMFSVPRDETEVMVSLSQKDVRDQRGLKAERGAATKKEAPGMGENFTIGFYVMKVCTVHCISIQPIYE